MQVAGFRAVPYSNPLRGHAETQPNAANAANDARSDQISEMLTKLREDSDKKDVMIAQLQDTIKGLNQQIATLTALLAQQGGAAPPQPLEPPQPPADPPSEEDAEMQATPKVTNIGTPTNSDQPTGFW